MLAKWLPSIHPLVCVLRTVFFFMLSTVQLRNTCGFPLMSARHADYADFADFEPALVLTTALIFVFFVASSMILTGPEDRDNLVPGLVVHEDPRQRHPVRDSVARPGIERQSTRSNNCSAVLPCDGASPPRVTLCLRPSTRFVVFSNQEPNVERSELFYSLQPW